MRWTSLIALFGVMALGTGCATSTQSAPPRAPAPQEEPIVIVSTPQSGMLPHSSQWEWTPPEQKVQASTEAQMQPTSLRAQNASRGEHLKKRLPKKKDQ